MATKPNVIVVKLPGLAGGQGVPGANGLSAINNVVNPVLTSNKEFIAKTDITDLGYDLAPSLTLTFEATIVVKGLTGSTVIVYVEGPADSVVSGIITYPYSAAPQPSGNSASFGITDVEQRDYYTFKLAGSIRNGNSSGRATIKVENLDGDSGAYVAAGSFAQWSVPATNLLIPGGTSGGTSGTNNGLTKDQADQIYASKNDTRLSDKRWPVDQSVNANTIASGGLPISSIDNLREELDSTIKTINGVSPDQGGNVNVSSSGTTAFSEAQADLKYTKLNDTRLTDQRIPQDNSVINVKVPNAALDVSKVNGLSAVLDAYTAQIASLTYRLQQIEQNGATPGGGTVGTGYAAVYPATY